MKRILTTILPCFLILFLLTVPLVASSCSGGSGGYGAAPTTTSKAPVSGNAVTISNFSFSPAALSVAVGTTVTSTNKDSVAHTMTSDTGAFDSGNIAPNATYSYKFNAAGTFAYHCAIHPSMKGMITVK
jgi:plastocyanin